MKTTSRSWPWKGQRRRRTFIDEEPVGGVILLKLHGRLDSTTAPELRERVRLNLENGRNLLVLDLSRVTFVDSSGLGSLVAALRSADKAGGNIKISALQPRVRAVFELIRLDHVFEVYEDALSAVRSY